MKRYGWVDVIINLVKKKMESVPGIQQVQNAYEVHETTSSLQSPAGIQKNSEQTEVNLV